jgi:hypothetical protein
MCSYLVEKGGEIARCDGLSRDKVDLLDVPRQVTNNMGRSVRTMPTTIGRVGRWTVAGLVLFSVISAGVGRAWTPNRGPIARATSETAEPGKMNSKDLEQRGRELRVQLEKTYDELVASRRLSGASTDITESVRRYFSGDMSFDEAEAILRAAGFSVEARPDVNAPQNPNRSIDWYAVLAKIPHFVVLFFSTRPR